MSSHNKNWKPPVTPMSEEWKKLLEKHKKSQLKIALRGFTK